MNRKQHKKLIKKYLDYRKTYEHREYKQCLGCGSCYNSDLALGKCEICGCVKYVVCIL